MRVYFEKPRTTVGWKGLINDPYLNDTYRLNDGLRIARKLLSDINDLGVPAAGEFFRYDYTSVFGRFYELGGRLGLEQQNHKFIVSWLQVYLVLLGLKNATNGGVKVALDAIGAAEAPHYFLSVTKFGHSAIVSTKGNEDCHIILRGGDKGPNYSAEDVEKVCADIEKQGVFHTLWLILAMQTAVNNIKKQMDVCQDVCNQIAFGSKQIFGVMVESHLVEGRQDLVDGKAQTYGQSITDACIGWEDSERLLQQLSDAVIARRKATSN